MTDHVIINPPLVWRFILVVVLTLSVTLKLFYYVGLGYFFSLVINNVVGVFGSFKRL